MPFNSAGHTVFLSPESPKTIVLGFQMQEDESAAHFLTCNMFTLNMCSFILSQMHSHSVPYTLTCNACSHTFSHVTHMSP